MLDEYPLLDTERKKTNTRINETGSDYVVAAQSDIKGNNSLFKICGNARKLCSKTKEDEEMFKAVIASGRKGRCVVYKHTGLQTCGSYFMTENMNLWLCFYNFKTHSYIYTHIYFWNV